MFASNPRGAVIRTAGPTVKAGVLRSIVVVGTKGLSAAFAAVAAAVITYSLSFARSGR